MKTEQQIKEKFEFLIKRVNKLPANHEQYEHTVGFRDGLRWVLE